jgi:Zn-finger nucleic acid-binding protein
MELIETRRYFQCRHCGAYRFPERIEAEGLRVSGTPADARPCPTCKTPFAHALLDNEFPVDFCTTCRGVFLPRETFATVVNKRRAWATSPPAEPMPLQHRELQRKLSCPQCGGPFDTFLYAGPGNVVIDNCARCDAVWLDFGELRQIVDAPGRDRGARHGRYESSDR